MKDNYIFDNDLADAYIINELTYKNMYCIALKEFLSAKGIINAEEFDDYLRSYIKSYMLRMFPDQDIR